MSEKMDELTPVADVAEAPIATAAVPVAEPAEVPMKDQPKKGSICCGCCCDMRRACVVLSIIGMIINIIYVIAAAAGTGLGFGLARFAKGNENFSQEDVDNLNAVGAFSAMTAIGYAVIFFFDVWWLIAALRYNVCMLSVVVFCLLCSMGYYIWVGWVNTQSMIDQGYATSANHVGDVLGPVIVWGLFMYPVIGLISEIKSGVMSPETYPREAHSCCCKPRV